MPETWLECKGRAGTGQGHGRGSYLHDVGGVEYKGILARFR
jgi:hypothetical protein